MPRSFSNSYKIKQQLPVTGVAAGGLMQVAVPCGKYRYHGLLFQVVAVNYTGGVPVSPKIIKSAAGAVGTGTVQLTVGSVANGNPGVPTGFVMAAGNSAGFAVGDTITVPDATGLGIVLTCTTLGGLVTANWSITTQGSATPMSPIQFFAQGGGQFLEIVDSKNMRDISVANKLAIMAANGLIPAGAGDLPLFYSEPQMKIRKHNTVFSWPTNNLSNSPLAVGSFTIQGQIASGILLPGVTCLAIYDTRINAAPALQNGKRVQVAFLNPVAHHQYGPIVVAAGGTVSITQQIPVTYPIRRIWIYGTVPDNITQVYMKRDSDVPIKALVGQLLSDLNAQGFTFAPVPPSGIVPIVSTRNGNLQANPFDVGIVFDDDERWENSMAVESTNGLQIDLTSSAAQNIYVVVESLPGAYR